MPSMLECDGQVWQCGDLEDNDGDGLVDFEDPDCINPCDDAEDGLPPRNFTVIDYNDCNRECFFDANTGVGDDQCLWNLKCDPENPGQDVACEYSDSNNCSNLPGTQTPECRAFCEPAVFPGCDCFGCCVIETTGGERGIYLDGGPDCSFDNLDACASCTPQIESCGNPCDRSSCERCFGDFELPPGCEVNTCDNGDSCNATSDCPDSYFCAWGCCYPPPPG
jgi:hypothetical protein